MRKLLVLAGLVVALAIPATALGAWLHEPHTGGVYSCPAGDVGTYHFVNNQTDGASAGTITVWFSSGQVGPVGPVMTLQNVQHFIVSAPGALLDAQTNLPGRLVLSDFSCKKAD